jgi:hypothetical protein
VADFGIRQGDRRREHQWWRVHADGRDGGHAGLHESRAGGR